MQNTIIAVYDSFAHAQGAMSELLANGFQRGSVQLNPYADSTGVERASSVDEQMQRSVEQPTESGEHRGVGAFFRKLFGGERADGDMYAEAIRRGGSVLTVNAESEQQRDFAISILIRFHPVDMDQRMSHWRSAGWSGYDENAPMLSQGEIDAERGTYPPTRQVDTSPPVHVFGKMAADAAQPGLGPVPRNSDFGDTLRSGDDADYRQHWRNVYAGQGTRYEDFDAAYRYGSAAAGSARFRNYRWEDAEPQLRGDWEAHHPEQAWERVKDAVRYGAEKVIGRDRRRS